MEKKKSRLCGIPQVQQGVVILVVGDRRRVTSKGKFQFWGSLHSFIRDAMRVCNKSSTPAIKIRFTWGEEEHVSWETVANRIDNQRIFHSFDWQRVFVRSVTTTRVGFGCGWVVVLRSPLLSSPHRHHHNHLQKRKCSSWNVPPIALGLAWLDLTCLALLWLLSCEWLVSLHHLWVLKLVHNQSEFWQEL